MNTFRLLIVGLVAALAVPLAPSAVLAAPEGRDWLEAKRKQVGAERLVVGSLRGATGGSRTVEEAGELPTGLLTAGPAAAGLGHALNWDRQDEELNLVVALNAADMLGTCVLNLEPGDVIQVYFASGIATFSQDQGNPKASSFLGVLAQGAKAATLAFGGEVGAAAAPLIDLARAEADKAFFQPTGRGHQHRDAHGFWNNHVHGQEGGVLVCLPGGGGPRYSGKDEALWFQVREKCCNLDTGGPHGRHDLQLPKHLQTPNEPGDYYYYHSLIPNWGPAPNRWTVRRRGALHLVAWDFAFQDNRGYYLLGVRITRGPR